MWTKTTSAIEKLRQYGLESEDYLRLYDAQEGKCKICGLRAPRVISGTVETKALFVDHDHRTGKVRGLLCSNCNAGLGFFKDSRGVLFSALRYLNEPV